MNQSLTYHETMDSIAKGYLLRVPHDGEKATVVRIPYINLGKQFGGIYEVDDRVASAATKNKNLRKLKLDGDQADYYCMTA